MAGMVKIAEIAKRVGVDLTTVRRLIARESDSPQIQLHRGKGDKLLLTKDDAERLVASYEARAALYLHPRTRLTPRSTTNMATSTSSSSCRRRCRIA